MKNNEITNKGILVRISIKNYWWQLSFHLLWWWSSTPCARGQYGTVPRTAWIHLPLLVVYLPESHGQHCQPQLAWICLACVQLSILCPFDHYLLASDTWESVNLGISRLILWTNRSSRVCLLEDQFSKRISFGRQSHFRQPSRAWWHELIWGLSLTYSDSRTWQH